MKNQIKIDIKCKNTLTALGLSIFMKSRQTQTAQSQALAGCPLFHLIIYQTFFMQHFFRQKSAKNFDVFIARRNFFSVCYNIQTTRCQKKRIALVNVVQRHNVVDILDLKMFRNRIQKSCTKALLTFSQKCNSLIYNHKTIGPYVKNTRGIPAMYCIFLDTLFSLVGRLVIAFYWPKLINPT